MIPWTKSGLFTSEHTYQGQGMQGVQGMQGGADNSLAALSMGYTDTGYHMRMKALTAAPPTRPKP
jgi:hypothetical protein